jgi:mono/diheme cytochrome c family protein
MAILATLAATLAMQGAASNHGAPVGGAPAADFARDVLPLLRDTCVDCHGGKEPAAGLALDGTRDEAGARATIGTWRRVREQLRRGAMPPPEAPAADEGQIAAARAWLDTRLGTGPGSWPLDAGRTPIRRLNRAEYGNTVRDLFDLPLAPEAKLPPDEVGYGFDNIAELLTVPPLLLEKYAALAEEIAAAALPGPELRTSVTRRFEAETLPTTLQKHGAAQRVANLYSAGSVNLDLELPRAGEYVVRASLSADQAGPEKARFAFRAGSRELRSGEVSCDERGEERHEWRGTLEGGRQRLAVAFLNDYYKEDAPDPRQRDRNLLVDWIEVEGPLDQFAPTPSERRLFPCGAAHPHVRECVPALLGRLAARAWRRPPNALEVGQLLGLVDDALAAGDSLTEALRHVVAAVLVSPRFLFRTELDAAPDDPGTRRPLDDFELAARLSYFCWSSLPDDRLQGLAEQGLLRNPAILADEARRLLRDVRSGALVINCLAQWLQLRMLAGAAPDPAAFPSFDDRLRDAMRLETELFLEAIVREGRPLSDLLDADFTFMNERLARHYGIDGVTGDAMRRVRVVDPARRGLLGHASLLTLTSNPTRTSPVKRGKFVLERLLGAPPPPPPPGVGVLDDGPQATVASTLRERLAAHRADPSCAGCHQKMDALGFALERFGPTGAWRGKDGPHPVDDRAALPDGRELRGPADLREVLLEDDSLTRTLAEKLLTYALGRGLGDDDLRAAHSLVDRYHGKSPSFEQLLLDVVALPAFTTRRGGLVENGR